MTICSLIESRYLLVLQIETDKLGSHKFSWLHENPKNPIHVHADASVQWKLLNDVHACTIHKHINFNFVKKYIKMTMIGFQYHADW